MSEMMNLLPFSTTRRYGCWVMMVPADFCKQFALIVAFMWPATQDYDHDPAAPLEAPVRFHRRSDGADPQRFLLPSRRVPGQADLPVRRQQGLHTPLIAWREGEGMQLVSVGCLDPECRDNRSHGAHRRSLGCRMLLCHLPNGPTAYFRVSASRLELMNWSETCVWLRALSAWRCAGLELPPVEGHSEPRKAYVAHPRAHLEQFQHQTGSTSWAIHGFTVPSSAGVWRTAGGHFPQPARLHLRQAPQVGKAPAHSLIPHVWVIQAVCVCVCAYDTGTSTRKTRTRRRRSCRSWGRDSRSSCGGCSRARSTRSSASMSGSTSEARWTLLAESFICSYLSFFVPLFACKRLVRPKERCWKVLGIFC